MKLKEHQKYFIFGVGYLILFLIIGIVLVFNAYKPVGSHYASDPSVVLDKPAQLYTGLILVAQSFFISVFAFIYGLKKKVD